VLTIPAIIIKSVKNHIFDFLVNDDEDANKQPATPIIISKNAFPLLEEGWRSDITKVKRRLYFDKPADEVTFTTTLMGAIAKLLVITQNLYLYYFTQN
jgi:hypothetical protein